MCIVDTSKGEFQHVKAGDRTPVLREVRVGDHEQYQYLHYPGERDFKHEMDPYPSKNSGEQSGGHYHSGVYICSPVHIQSHQSSP